MSFKLTLDFESDADRDDFIGWFLDGGGEYEFNEGRRERGDVALDTSGPGGGDWEWSTPSKAVPVMENYTIELRPYPEEGDEP